MTRVRRFVDEKNRWFADLPSEGYDLLTLGKSKLHVVKDEASISDTSSSYVHMKGTVVSQNSDRCLISCGGLLVSFPSGDVKRDQDTLVHILIVA